jgi:hypothetical protein
MARGKNVRVDNVQMITIYDLHGFPSRLATQADLQPTGKPVESKGPLSCAGQFGPKSTGHEGTGQPLLLSILTGRLYPSTSETFKDRSEQAVEIASETTHHRTSHARQQRRESIPRELREEHRCLCADHRQGHRCSHRQDTSWGRG